MWSFLEPMLGPIIDKIVDRIPNPNERQKAKEEFKKDLLNAVSEANKAQAKINETEAQHKSIFVAGWRPFIGWICGIGILWAFILQPIAVWTVKIFGIENTQMPAINSNGLFQLVFAMLGMGGLRTYEKIKGVARNTTPFREK